MDGAIEAQRKLVSGFGSDPKIRKAFREALEPRHFAISLDGEPMLYPYIEGLVKEVKSRGYTAFLVTNGTMPHKLKELIENCAAPTNLYISVYAANGEDYKKITISSLPDTFERVSASLKLMGEFEKAGSRTIFRMTCVKGLNMGDPEGFSRLIRMSRAQIVELKGYAWLGESRKRLDAESAPSMDDLMGLARELEKSTGYSIRLTDGASRVVMLTRDEYVWSKLESSKPQKHRPQ